RAWGGGRLFVCCAAGGGCGVPPHARGKLERKGLDVVVLNDISRADIGFDSEENEVTILTRAGERQVERSPKSAVAAAILDEVEGLRGANVELRP
ncbi:MAG: phosphopantothenoylcysteine decarboxylase, partial [Thermoleophilaceae bacterium]